MKQTNLNKLERSLDAAGANAEPIKMWIFADQNEADPDLWRTQFGDHTSAGLDDLAEDYNLIMVLYPGHKHEN